MLLNTPKEANAETCVPTPVQLSVLAFSRSRSTYKLKRNCKFAGSWLKMGFGLVWKSKLRQSGKKPLWKQTGHLGSTARVGENLASSRVCWHFSLFSLQAGRRC